MKTEKIKRKFYFIFFIVLFIISSCQSPSKSEIPGEKLKPPGSLSAIMENEYNVISWASTPCAEHYMIYRTIDNHNWIAISSLIEGTKFKDYCPEYSNDIVYAVKSEKNGNYSELSPSSNIIPRCFDDERPAPPEEIQASRINDHVLVYWSEVQGTDGYSVYKKIGEANWIRVKRIYNYNETSWIDKNVPYDLNIEYGVKTKKNNYYSEMITVALHASYNVNRPVVESFCKTGAIYIKWDNDARADSYNLLRDTSPAGDFKRVVYSGQEPNYTDSDIIHYQFYYYKLELLKNGLSLGKSDDYFFGLGGPVIKDNNEDNNSPETATILNTGNNYVNIYYFEDAYGNILQDEDWYYFVVPSLMTVSIRIDRFQNIGSGNDIIYTQPDQEPYSLNDGDEFLLSNPEDQDKEIFFSISLNYNNYSNKMGSYRIVVE